MARTFRRGTHPPTHKRYQDYPLEDFKVPEKLYVSLSQHIGAPAKAVVSIGVSGKKLLTVSLSLMSRSSLENLSKCVQDGLDN